MKVALSGRRINKWQVIKPAPHRGTGYFWFCKCKHRKIYSVRQYDLLHGKSKQCKCRFLKKDLTGKRFGRFDVLKELPKEGGHRMWRCRCRCADKTIKKVNQSNLLSGASQSCGCLRKELTSKKFFKHGNRVKSKSSPTYSVWVNMNQRCYNPKSTVYRFYGALGITVCKRWKKSFRNFVNDMGVRPSLDYTLDRIKGHRGYTPSNCRWLTLVEQQRNRKNNIRLSLNGETKILSQWAETLKISNAILYRQFLKQRTKRIISITIRQSGQKLKFYRIGRPVS